MIPIGLCVLLGLVAGILVLVVARRRGPVPPGAVAQEAVDRVATVRPARHLLGSEAVGPATATSVGLTVAAIAVIATGLTVGVLAFWIRRDVSFLSFDELVERWAEANATSASDTALRTLTHLGDSETAIVVGLAVSAWIAVRHRTLAAFAFLTLVIGGQTLITNLIKVGVDRARPALSPRAGFGGQSFPSGHAATAAACFLAVALILSISRPPRTRAVLMSVAVGLGVAVASTRVLLGVHWASDAVAGLAVGWAWYLVSAAVFGGRLLSFGAPVEEAVAGSTPGSTTGATGARSQAAGSRAARSQAEGSPAEGPAR